MTSICRIDINKGKFLYGNVKLECGEKSGEWISLFDTGATVCHMTYPLWKTMGLDELLFEENPPLMKLLGLKSPADFTFETLPMMEKATILGDNTKIRAYEVCLDYLTLGVRSLSSQPIRLEKITVRLMDSPKLKFIVGENVLKYLKTNYNPDINNAIYNFELTPNGKHWLETDRQNKISNFMTSRFNYLEI
ncbi:MAG: hypothetical protein FWG68_12890 [Defluviitaleaceae bacterium]|nr:hypothetical protein [Defluviitaleaceae bacterium]